MNCGLRSVQLEWQMFLGDEVMISFERGSRCGRRAGNGVVPTAKIEHEGSKVACSNTGRPRLRVPLSRAVIERDPSKNHQETVLREIAQVCVAL